MCSRATNAPIQAARARLALQPLHEQILMIRVVMKDGERFHVRCLAQPDTFLPRRMAPTHLGRELAEGRNLTVAASGTVSEGSAITRGDSGLNRRGGKGRRGGGGPAPGSTR